VRTTRSNKKAGVPKQSKPTHEEAIAAAVRIEKLRTKHTNLEAQMAKVEQKIADSWSVIDQVFPTTMGKQRCTVERPRPVGDKLIISAGKAIAAAIRNGDSLQQTKAAAIQAATKVARKYGLASIPSDVVAKVEGRVQTLFSGVLA
jgi:hypothetical protein